MEIDLHLHTKGTSKSEVIETKLVIKKEKPELQDLKELKNIFKKIASKYEEYKKLEKDIENRLKKEKDLEDWEDWEDDYGCAPPSEWMYVNQEYIHEDIVKLEEENSFINNFKISSLQLQNIKSDAKKEAVKEFKINSQIKFKSSKIEMEMSI